MTKIFCDCCGSEGRYDTIKIPCHIAERDSKRGDYVDNTGEPVSGRTVDYDLCARCTNRIYSVVMTIIHERAEEENRRTSR